MLGRIIKLKGSKSVIIKRVITLIFKLVKEYLGVGGKEAAYI